MKTDGPRPPGIDHGHRKVVHFHQTGPGAAHRATSAPLRSAPLLGCFYVNVVFRWFSLDGFKSLGKFKVNMGQCLKLVWSGPNFQDRAFQRSAEICEEGMNASLVAFVRKPSEASKKSVLSSQKNKAQRSAHESQQAGSKPPKRHD